MKFKGRKLAVWALFCILAGLTMLAYGVASFAAGRGEPVMPLDDVYIHFQYAKQLAAGQPYIYNPGLPPTSGATSFLYPYLLAIGYLLGFQGLNLGLWAMLLGMVALAVSSWLVYRLVRIMRTPDWLALGTAVVFAISGPVAWHFMSGMETGLVVLFTLATLYYIIPPALKSPMPVTPERERAYVRNAVMSAALVALLRPEGGLLAVLAVGVLFLQTRTPPPNPLPVYREGEKMRRFDFKPYTLLLVIPILAIGVQPLVNLLLTGSAVASGNASKSIFGIVPFAWDEVIRRVLENWGRMWAEFLTGSSPREGIYFIPLMLILSAAALVMLLRDRGWRAVGLMLVGWLAFGTLAISTLDTAFWHFKRYQMSFIALLFPLAAWGLMTLWRLARRPQLMMAAQSGVYIVGALTFMLTIQSWTQFFRSYALNVDYVYLQPLQMARWLEANTPSDSVVAVHDTGLLRYMGGRTTIDMVGLTTPGAADYWRNGPGSVAEFLIQQRPDYIASYGYGHGFGLGMLADTDLYGEPLASFPVQLDPHYNVALAADFQGIYQPNWENMRLMFVEAGLQMNVWNYFYPENLSPVARLNVANIEVERAANYYWTEQTQVAGFPTEVHQFDYVDCIHPDNENACSTIDGGRKISGEESFTLTIFEEYEEGIASDAFLLITRLQSVGAATFDVYANGEYVATRWIADIPGQWIEIPTRIPNPGRDATEQVQIRIVTHGNYLPYYHTLVYADDSANIEGDIPKEEIVRYQNGAIVLAAAQIDYQAGAAQMPINFEWYTDGSAQGDYKLFVHVLDDNDQIVAQADGYPGGGTLPPGNWLPGVLRDTVVVDLAGTPPGIYGVAIGFYDPYTGERLQPDSGDDRGRFFIGDVEIR